MKRRRFLTSLAGAAAVAPVIGSTRLAADVPPPVSAEIGSTGIKTSRLAQGTGLNAGRRVSELTNEGFEDFLSLMEHGYDRGIRFYDLADWYGTHVYMREALKRFPRDEITLLSKIWPDFDGKDVKKLTRPMQKRMAENAAHRFCQEIGVETIDIVLMHCMRSADWSNEYEGYLEGLTELKDKGIIRAMGMSCHTLNALKRAAEIEWVEVALTRINPYGIAMDGTPEEVIPVQKKFKERGAGVIGMKIFGAGKLIDKRDECMQFAQNLGYLDAMTIGAKNKEEIDDNLRLMAKYPAV